MNKTIYLLLPVLLLISGCAQLQNLDKKATTTDNVGPAPDVYLTDNEIYCRPYENEIDSKATKTYPTQNFCEKPGRSRYFDPMVVDPITFKDGEDTAKDLCVKNKLDEKLLEKYKSINCPSNCPLKSSPTIYPPLTFCEVLRPGTGSNLECFSNLIFYCDPAEQTTSPSVTPKESPLSSPHIQTPLVTPSQASTPTPSSAKDYDCSKIPKKQQIWKDWITDDYSTGSGHYQTITGLCVDETKVPADQFKVLPEFVNIGLTTKEQLFMKRGCHPCDNQDDCLDCIMPVVEPQRL